MAEALIPDGDRLQEFFDQALELRAEERERYLASLSAQDAGLGAELRDLLSADEAAGRLECWSRPAVAEPESLDTHSPADCIGDTVGSYRIVELLGRGGMGAVYRGVRIGDEFQMSVAIKRIQVQLGDRDSVSRFRAERRILAQLEHPNIARLLDGGSDEVGLPYLAMELVEGIPPLDYCSERDLSTRQRLEMFRQICSAVHYAHQRMVIHRDLKPANILVTPGGAPKLLDFGIAKVFAPEPASTADAAAQTSMHLMTARYASPEQVRGEAVTAASDLYSLGVMLYELLTGQSPYRNPGSAPHELMTAVCTEEPVKPSVRRKELRGDLDNIVLKALRKEPGERYASVAEFSEDILRYLEGRPVLACSDAFHYVAAKFIRRHRVATAAATLILITLIGSLVAVARARARADQRFNELRSLAHSVMFDYADAIDRLPGSTPVRAHIVSDALTYLDNLSRQADTPQLAREIVEAYVHVSAIQGDAYQNNLGDAAGALRTSRKGAAAAEKLMARDGSPEALATAAEAFSVEASLLYSADDLQGADREYRRAVDLREAVSRARPDDVDNAIALSAALRHTGELYGSYGNQNLGKTAESVKFFERAAEIVRGLSARYPGSVPVARARYDALLQLAASEHSRGLRDAARGHLMEASAQIHKVVASGTAGVGANTELANVEVRIGLMLLDARNPSEALPHIARSAGILDRLSAADPANAVLRRSLAVVENQWAAALGAAGNWQAAIEHNRRSLALARDLSSRAPSNVEYRSDVGIGERKFSDTLLAAGDAAGALKQAYEAREMLCDAGMAKDAYLEANCGRALVSIGNALLGLKRGLAAVETYRRAEQVAARRSGAEPISAVYRSDLARAQAALAAGLVRVEKREEAVAVYESALRNWSMLRDTDALSAEDAYRADAAAGNLAAIQH
jgi:eukaryotic-like serine/threonine-protein kinase